MLGRFVCSGLQAQHQVRMASVCLLLLTPGGIAFSVRAAEPPTVQTQTEVSRAGTLIGRTNAAQTMTLAVPLKPHNQAALDDFLAQLYDPAAPAYHQYLTSQQFTQRFFDIADRAQMDNYLRARIHRP